MMNARENLMQQIVALLPEIRKVAGRILRNPADVDDVAQQVAVEMIENAERGADVRDLRAWLMVAARTRAIDAIRRGARFSSLPEVAAAAADTEPLSPEARRMWEAFEAACRCSRDSARIRRWAWMHYGEGVSQAEIAEESATSLVTIKGALYNLRKRARAIFEKEAE